MLTHPSHPIAGLLKEFLVGHILCSPLVVSYLAHAVATKIISMDSFTTSIIQSVESKSISISEYESVFITFSSSSHFYL